VADLTRAAFAGIALSPRLSRGREVPERKRGGSGTSRGDVDRASLSRRRSMDG
jgi:hypothetical protein